MKKVLFCSAMVACCTVALQAQQTTSPLFKNYLNKKNTLASSLPGTSLPGKGHFWYDVQPNNNRAISPLVKSSDENNSLLGAYAGKVSKGNNLYILPLDNMPCVVPDLSAFHMPVIKPDLNIDPQINSAPGR